MVREGPRRRADHLSGGHRRRATDPGPRRGTGHAARNEDPYRGESRLRAIPAGTEGLRLRGRLPDARLRDGAAAAHARAARGAAGRGRQCARAPARHGGANAGQPLEAPPERQLRADRVPAGAAVGAGRDGTGAAGRRRRTAGDDRADDRRGNPGVGSRHDDAGRARRRAAGRRC